MTTVECFYNEKTKQFILRVYGHAGYNKENDIVCSACSMLTFTAWQAIVDLEDESLLKNVKSSKSEGYMNIEAEFIDVNTSLNVLRGIIKGYEMLECKYPKNVQLMGIDSVDNVCRNKKQNLFYSVIKK